MDTDPSAAACGLEHDGIAERLGGRHRLGGIRQETGPRHKWHAGRGRSLPSGVLDAEELHLLRRGSHEHEAGGLNPPGEVRVFGEEPIAGMNGARPGLVRRRQ